MTDFLPWRGNYRNLIIYRKSAAVYDMAYFFAHKFLRRGDRTNDQMVQAARSCKQNIVEGVCAATTSKETELKLVNVAKSSLHELMEDYEDFLRVRSLRRWKKGEKAFDAWRGFCSAHNDPADFTEWTRQASPEAICNVGLIMCRQLDYLLFKYIESAKAQFLKAGGIREQMTRARLAARNPGLPRAGEPPKGDMPPDLKQT